LLTAVASYLILIPSGYSLDYKVPLSCSPYSSELALTDYFNPLPEEYIAGSEDDPPEGVAEQDF